MDIDSESGSKATTVTERVNETIRSYDSVAEGCSVDQIIFKLKGLHTEHEIREAVDYLQNEGQCYTTIDNEHVKSCLP